MWKGNIQRTERDGKTLNIIISYTNGVSSFDETIVTDKPQNETWLSEQIAARLNQLNGLDEYEASINQASIVSAPELQIDEQGVLVEIKEDPEASLSLQEEKI